MVSPQSLRTNVLLALAAREAHDWAADVPWPVFLNDVLPYANLDEPRDDWRLLFQPLMAPVVANASSITEAAQVLNRDIWAMWGIVFKPHQTPDIMSPSQVGASSAARRWPGCAQRSRLLLWGSCDPGTT